MHDAGLTIQEGEEGTTPRRIVFDDVDALYCSVTDLPWKFMTVTLVTFAGVRWTVPRDLEERSLLLAAIERKVTAPLRREAAASHARGEPLTFGPVVVTSNGLTLEGDVTCWSDLSHVVVEKQVVVFHAREPRGRLRWLALAKIPHPRILFALLQMHGQVVFDEREWLE